MNLAQIRKHWGREEIDHQALLSYLNSYANPRNKINYWLRTNELIRVKKGLYVFGPSVAQQTYSVELLANLIYGPSAISLHYALSYYGLIPETVQQITSITNKRHKTFITPIGRFSYHYIHPKKYPIGIQLINSANDTRFLMASPEKALCDLLYIERHNSIFTTNNAMSDYLFSDLRIDEELLTKFNIDLVIAIAKTYKNPNINTLVDFLKR